MLLVLSQAACEHIAYVCNERAWRDTDLLEDGEADATRMLFVRVAMMSGTTTVMFNLNSRQVRALDMLLTDSDPREGKLPDGTPILTLVRMIWEARIGGPDARDEDGRTDEDHDTDEAERTAVR